MGWRGVSVAEQRLELVRAMGLGEASVGEVCARFGVSRKTGYKWKARYEEEGLEGLMDRSHAPLRHGRASDESVVQALLNLKAVFPAWGPRKLVSVLERRHPEVRWPSHSTAGEILKRAGLVGARVEGRRARPTLGPLRRAEHCNSVWTADHKGWVRLGNGERCDPLAVIDGRSRYVLALEAASGTGEREARGVFERAFAAHGLPEAIRTDNGAPFAASGVVGLTKLSAWWVQLGVRLERIAPGRPQQNGAHERFNLTLKEALTPAPADRASQQARFDAFRETFNTQRPHEALKTKAGMQTPADVYEMSPRLLPATSPEPAYPETADVRRVRPNGEIKWRGGELYISQALAGQDVALTGCEAGHDIHYYDLAIAFIPNGKTRIQPPPKLSPIHPG